MALRKYGTRAYGPFLLSLLLEALSGRASRTKFLTESDLEKSERARRQMQLWRYLLRGPAWAAFTKPRAKAFADNLESKSIIGYAGTMLKEYINLFDRFLYYNKP
jgi:peroxin-16